jgi:NAD(P)-dependent dehydrogenase (short-subunit alcohol dehydrogenase family)
MKNLNNKVAVVFAASGAIAGAVAKSLAKHGAKVYVSARNTEDTKAVNMLADDIKQSGAWAEATNLAYDHLKKYKRWNADALDKLKALAPSNKMVYDAINQVSYASGEVETIC